MPNVRLGVAAAGSEVKRRASSSFLGGEDDLGLGDLNM
jgi:hypothetical protein